MREVVVKVTLQVDSDGVLSESEAESVAVEAVTKALRVVEGMGFSHRHADVASVDVADVSLA